jgi:tripartite-type tricarboxylate transporter receptor subunit TctC
LSSKTSPAQLEVPALDESRVHPPPDGYTLIAGIWSTHVTNGAVYKLKYDVVGDFAPIALLTKNPQLIVAKKTMAASDLQGFIAWLKGNPDKAYGGSWQSVTHYGCFV